MNKFTKCLRNGACIILAVFETFAFSGCSEEDNSDTIPYSEYLVQEYGENEKNFHFPGSFDDLQIWVTQIGNDFVNNDVKVVKVPIDDEIGFLRVLDHRTDEELASIVYSENEFENALDLLKKEFEKRNGQIVVIVNYYDIVKRLFGEKGEYTDDEIFAVDRYVDDFIDIKLENIK